ncbi:amino acid ABC transporter ATP-binding protein [Mycobacterium sp. 21AC1]|uniref:amino acid ABC transporter ATP-binding protein n=1 Tax=[Mycobacterium] appelbergii TaxID=2939269 RepID=UPI0029390369|nr:amino acid ABC transporter ATP-binding protein [Mycobacterium sp. 21AC1]MDV3127654.1 amino acid ABC transporter ATP-binding protein [Mycobacterium sp. 21AC1]
MPAESTDGTGTTILSARSLVKKFGEFTALDGVDIDLTLGEVAVLVGSSGSGKSTLIRCLNLLEPVDAGEIEFNGELLGAERTDRGLVRRTTAEILRQRRYFGMVFQSFNLFPHMTALQNVESGPRFVLGRQGKQLSEHAAALLARVGLAGKEGSYPGQLSGGQQQRVAIARALAMNPEIMLFDEPTSALDPELVDEVFDVIRDLAAGGTTMMIVTHEMRFARRIADTLVYMDNGRILERGTPEQVMTEPETERAQAFFSRTH